MLDASRPAARLARDAPARRRSAAFARLAEFLAPDVERLRDALRHVFEREVQHAPEARSRPRSGPAPRPAEAAEKIAQPEEVPEHRENVVNVRVLPVVDARPAQARLAELVVPPALVRVGEDLVGLGALFEACLGLSVARVAVGVVLDRALPVAGLDLIGRGSARDPENVVITFVRRHRLPRRGLLRKTGRRHAPPPRNLLARTCRSPEFTPPPPRSRVLLPRPPPVPSPSRRPSASAPRSTLRSEAPSASPSRGPRRPSSPCRRTRPSGR